MGVLGILFPPSRTSTHHLPAAALSAGDGKHDLVSTEHDNSLVE